MVHDEVTSSTDKIPDSSLCPEQRELKRTTFEDLKEEDDDQNEVVVTINPSGHRRHAKYE
jgi:hypothetical protein